MIQEGASPKEVLSKNKLPQEPSVVTVKLLGAVITLSAEAVCRYIMDDENSDGECYFDGSDDDFGAYEIEAVSSSGHDLDIGEEISIPNVRQYKACSANTFVIMCYT